MMLLHGLARLEASSSRIHIRTGAVINVFHRHYVIKVPQGTATGERPSTSTTTPRQVRLRRKLFPITPIGENDGVEMSDSDRRRYQWLKERNRLGEGVTAQQWIDERNSWRNRVRGIRYSRFNVSQPPPPSRFQKRKNDDGKEAEDGQEESAAAEGVSEEELSQAMTLEPKAVVGQRIYLPNIIFRLVRNTTPPGRPYDPYIATFRVPKSLTKLDIKSYLSAVYGVETTFIRTENFISQIIRSIHGGQRMRMSRRTYKRAIVGLVDPFYYPLAKEDMTQEEREEREKWENDNFDKKLMDQMEKRKFGFGNSKLLTAAISSDSKATKGRGKIIREIMRRKAEREGLILDAAASSTSSIITGSPDDKAPDFTA